MFLKLTIIFTVFEMLFSQVSATSDPTTVVGGTGRLGNSGDGGPATSARVFDVTSCWVDSNENLFFVDFQADVARMVDTSGIISTFLGTGRYGISSAGGPGSSISLANPWGIAGDSNFIYVSDFYHIWKYIRATAQVVVYAGTTTQGYSGDGGPATSAELNIPRGMWLTTDGTLYFADYNNQVVRSISSSGIINLVAGTPTSSGYSGDGGLATDANLSYPSGVYVDSNGVLYIADKGNDAIRFVNNGIINTSPITKGSSDAISNPSDVKGDSTGNLYIADRFNIRVVTTNNHTLHDYLSGQSGLDGLWIDNEANKVYFGSNYYVYSAQMFIAPTKAPSSQPTTISTDHPSFPPQHYPQELSQGL